jgi:hypothetical protein
MHRRMKKEESKSLFASSMIVYVNNYIKKIDGCIIRIKNLINEIARMVK